MTQEIEEGIMQAPSPAVPCHEPTLTPVLDKSLNASVYLSDNANSWVSEPRIHTPMHYLETGLQMKHTKNVMVAYIKGA